MTLAVLLEELETKPGCGTCAWYQELPQTEQALFDRYIQHSIDEPFRFSRQKLFDKCAEMGYPLKKSAFKECIREHHVHK